MVLREREINMLLTFHEFAYQGYNLLINEELNDVQKRSVDSWPDTGKAKQISKHVIPLGQDRISIPLEDSTGKKDDSSIPHPAVEAHLKKHGYTITDYKGGYAEEDKYKRPISIGKALNKTKAPSEVMNAFTSDPKRAASTQKAKGLKVIISRHPHDVAGMSTGQGWTSCVNMSGGCNSHYLRGDVMAGTHVAYLVHDHDHEAKNPIARIALKPFTSEDETHKILRQESRTYGTPPSGTSFADTVKKWTEKNFPLDPTKAYKKDPAVYHDTGSRIIAGEHALAKAKDAKIRASAFKKTNTDVTPEQISTGLKDTAPQVAMAAMKHPNATNAHIKEAMSHPNEKVRQAAVSHTKATAEDITQGLKDTDLNVRMSAIGNKKATKEHVRTALQDSSPHVRSQALLTHPKHIEAKDLPQFTDNGMGIGTAEMALAHPLATTEHVDKALKNKDELIRAKAAQHPKLSRNSLTKVLKDPDKSVRFHGVKRNDTTAADRENAMNDKESLVRAAAVSHKDTTESQLTKGMKDKSADVRSQVLMHPNATVKHVDIGINDSDQFTRRLAAKHPKATPEHIHKALKDENPNVRIAAMKNPNATPEHIHKALDDSDSEVKQTALKNPNVTSEHITKGLKDKDRMVRVYAVNHPKATSEHIHKGLDDSDDVVRVQAMQNPNATSEHVAKGLKDKNWSVRWTAATHPNATKEQKKAFKDDDGSMMSPR